MIKKLHHRTLTAAAALTLVSLGATYEARAASVRDLDRDGIPNVLVEAMAAGLPVVASRVGGIPEILGPDSEALVEAGRADLFAAIMARALTDPDWSKRTMPTPESFWSRFSAVVMARELEGVYRAQLARI